MSSGEIRVPIDSDQDIVVARQRGRALAGQVGFSPVDSTLIATTISELARNIISYAGKGEIRMKILQNSAHEGILIVASDKGPGIPDIGQALRDGFSTSGGLGLGLPGVRRLVDEFIITSQPGRGTRVEVKKWRH